MEKEWDTERDDDSEVRGDGLEQGVEADDCDVNGDGM